jgi:hypothetical protein
MQRLQPSYNVLSNIGRRQGHCQPLYAVGGIQRTAAEGFLQAWPVIYFTEPFVSVQQRCHAQQQVFDN